MTSPHAINFPAHRQSVMGKNGVVTSGHPLASQAGLRMLLAGGNAIDAAIAAAAAVGVTEPQNSGVGGDGFIMLFDAKSGRMFGVNATGPAPRAATREFYLDREGIPMRGILSVSVPGLVDGWLIAHERFGRIPLKDVLEPAIQLCEDGFPVSQKLSATYRAHRAEFARDPKAMAIFEPSGRPLETGEILVQRDLGTTLRRIVAEGRAVFYEGGIARRVCEFSRESEGLLTEEDFSGFKARWEEPIHTDYHGYRVFEMPPNCSGHVLLQELNIVENFDLAGMGCNSAQSIHIMVEAKKLAFADRERFSADPDWVDVPIDRLLSKGYARKLADKIDPERAAPIVAPGMPEGVGDTTCLTTADRDGNVVCLLQSLQSEFGSCRFAGDTGILLNNRMTYWHLDEDHPNCLMPGKRVRHTMNPVIALRGGRPAIVCGTPGADTQVQTNLQLLTHALHFGMSPQEAVEAPRWRNLQNPMESTIPHTCSDLLQVESRFSAEVLDGLRERGHELEILSSWGGTGNAQFISIEPETGVLSGGVDPRRDGYSVAY